MFFIISKIAGFLFIPSHLSIFLVAIGAALLHTRWMRLGRAVATTGAALLLLIAFGPIGHWLAAPLEMRFPPPPEDMPAPTGIIVLGGTVDEVLSGELGRPIINEAAERITAPAALLRKYPNARLVFSGGSAALRTTKWSEADAVRHFWRDQGIDRGDILYEDRSRNTYENAIFTRDLVQPKAGERWLLVTSATHMPRSVGIFRKAGFDVVPYPVDYHTNMRLPSFSIPRFAPRAIVLVDAATHEWVGLVAYWLTGKSDSLFPGPVPPDAAMDRRQLAPATP